MTPPRIAFVVPDDSTAWLYYHHLIEALLESGASVTVLSAPGPFAKRFREIGASHVPVPYARFVSPFSDISLFRELRKNFVRRRFDIVQNFTVKANLYGALAAISAGIPTIINTVEGAGILWSEPTSPKVRLLRTMVEAVLRRIRSRIHRYWFVNAHDRDLFVARGMTSSKQSVIAISTGVDTSEFDPNAIPVAAIESARRELGISPARPVITMVAGRLLRSKGVEVFLRLASRLHNAGISVHALLVGPEDFGHPDALDTSIVQRAVKDGVVRWVGFRDDVATIYAASDVIVVPTTYAEGIAKSVVEPMAMAKPVVCFRTAAIEEMVEAGTDSILVAPGDEDAMYAAVVDLLRDPRRRSDISRAARVAILERFDAHTQAEIAVDRVYGSVPGWKPRRHSESMVVA